MATILLCDTCDTATSYEVELPIQPTDGLVIEFQPAPGTTVTFEVWQTKYKVADGSYECHGKVRSCLTT